MLSIICQFISFFLICCFSLTDLGLPAHEYLECEYNMLNDKNNTFSPAINFVLDLIALMIFSRYQE